MVDEIEVFDDGTECPLMVCEHQPTMYRMRHKQIVPRYPLYEPETDGTNPFSSYLSLIQWEEEHG